MAFSKPFTMEEKEYMLRHKQDMTAGALAQTLTTTFKVEERTAKGVQSFIYNYHLEMKPITILANPDQLRWLGWDGNTASLKFEAFLTDEIAAKKGSGKVRGKVTVPNKTK